MSTINVYAVIEKAAELLKDDVYGVPDTAKHFNQVDMKFHELEVKKSMALLTDKAKAMPEALIVKALAENLIHKFYEKEPALVQKLVGLKGNETPDYLKRTNATITVKIDDLRNLKASNALEAKLKQFLIEKKGFAKVLNAKIYRDFLEKNNCKFNCAPARVLE